MCQSLLNMHDNYMYVLPGITIQLL